MAGLQPAAPRRHRRADRGAARAPARRPTAGRSGRPSATWPASACSGCATSPASRARRRPGSRTPATTARATTTSSTSSAPRTLVEALDSTFRIVEGCLDRGPSPMLDEELRRPEWDESGSTPAAGHPARLQPTTSSTRRAERGARAAPGCRRSTSGIRRVRRVGAGHRTRARAGALGHTGQWRSPCTSRTRSSRSAARATASAGRLRSRRSAAAPGSRPSTSAQARARGDGPTMAGAGDRLSTHVVDSPTARPSRRSRPPHRAPGWRVDGLVHLAAIIQPFVRSRTSTTPRSSGWSTSTGGARSTSTRAFLPVLLERPEGHIVNASSMGGFIPVPGQTIYGASKAAVKLLTEGLYAECRGDAGPRDGRVPRRDVDEHHPPLRRDHRADLRRRRRGSGEATLTRRAGGERRSSTAWRGTPTG